MEKEQRAFDERLWVPWWWWPIAAAVIAVLGAELHLGFGPMVAVVIYAALGGLVASLLIRWAVPIRIDGDVLRVGVHRIPLDHVTGVRVLDRADARRVLVDRPDGSAVMIVRGYVARVVHVTTDADGDLPGYLLVSSRRADDLAAAVGCRTDR
ncbi:MAG: DUF3093 family protein [Streptosporangiales bacterium]|nr:DUF3093 family protein [Streptosporangiales bacterium]